ncbi:MAG: DUF4149 domain-containing protein [Nitrospirae bacterium]|nr:DUF4149 domain-containing protein [Nitrospirota bacterium]
MAYFFYNVLLSLWIGGMAIFTFVITPVIFRSFGRDMAGEIVGKLFPVYFPYNLVLSLLTLIFLFLLRSETTRSGYKVSLILIGIAVIINIFLIFKLHPEVKKIKAEIHSVETTSPDSPLMKKFRRLHGVSMILNLVLLSDGITLLYLSSSLKE